MKAQLLEMETFSLNSNEKNDILNHIIVLCPFLWLKIVYSLHVFLPKKLAG